MKRKSKQSNTQGANGKFLIAAGYVLMLGSSLAASALLGLYLGSILDKGRPQKIFAPLGFLLGLGVGFHNFYRVIRNLLNRLK